MVSGLARNHEEPEEIKMNQNNHQNPELVRHAQAAEAYLDFWSELFQSQDVIEDGEVSKEEAAFYFLAHTEKTSQLSGDPKILTDIRDEFPEDELNGLIDGACEFIRSANHVEFFEDKSAGICDEGEGYVIEFITDSVKSLDLIRAALNSVKTIGQKFLSEMDTWLESDDEDYEAPFPTRIGNYVGAQGLSEDFCSAICIFRQHLLDTTTLSVAVLPPEPEIDLSLVDPVSEILAVARSLGLS